MATSQQHYGKWTTFDSLWLYVNVSVDFSLVLSRPFLLRSESTSVLWIITPDCATIQQYRRLERRCSAVALQPAGTRLRLQDSRLESFWNTPTNCLTPTDKINAYLRCTVFLLKRTSSKCWIITVFNLTASIHKCRKTFSAAAQNDGDISWSCQKS